MEPAKKEKALNPFALPPETNARFSLLLVSVMVISLILGNYLPLYFLPDDTSGNLFAPKVDFTDTGIETPDDLKGAGIKMIMNSLKYVPSILILLFIVLITFLVSFLIYRNHAAKIISKQNLRVVRDSGSNEYTRLKEEVHGLSQLYGIESPGIFVSPRFTTGAQAFGFKNKSMLRIDNGLRMMSVKDNRKFRSIMLHELAHISNGDVSRTYIAGSLWKAVLYVFAVPTILVISVTFASNLIKRMSDGFYTKDFTDIAFRSLPASLILLFSLGIFFLIMYLLLKSLVRIREYYADSRAAVGGAKEDLRGLFEDNLKNEKRVTGYKKFFSWHPSMRERIDNLEDQYRLFILKNDLSFIVGLLIPFSLFSFFVLGKIGLSLTGILSGASQVLTQNQELTYLSVAVSILIIVFVCFIPFFVTSYLISSSIGLQIQKNVIAAIDSANMKVFGFKKIFVTSVFITLGMAAGSLILPYYSVLNFIVENTFREILFEKLPFVLLALMFAFIVNFVWVFYLKFYAGRLYGRYMKKQFPKLRYFVFNFISAILLSILILPVAGIYFRVYSNEIDLVNEAVNTLAYLTPLIYAVVFALTGIIILIMNSGNTRCQNCSSPVPSGNLIGKECVNCKTMFSKWLYL
jgi:Zn-dependent protease with chaperone function